MLEWLTNRKRLRDAELRIEFLEGSGDRWANAAHELRLQSDETTASRKYWVGAYFKVFADLRRLQAHAVRLYSWGDEEKSYCLAYQAQGERLQSDLERQRLWVSSVQSTMWALVRNGDHHIQRVEAERDEAWQEATAAMGARDAWQQTAGELQAGIDRREHTIERHEARIKALQEALAAAQKNDKRGPDGRFRKV